MNRKKKKRDNTKKNAKKQYKKIGIRKIVPNLAQLVEHLTVAVYHNKSSNQKVAGSIPAVRKFFL